MAKKGLWVWPHSFGLKGMNEERLVDAYEAIMECTESTARGVFMYLDIFELVEVPETDPA